MLDDVQNDAISTEPPIAQEAPPAVPVPEFEAPQSIGEPEVIAEAGGALLGQLVVKRGGVETDDVFNFAPPAIIGRFDPAVGPIDVDLGSLPEGVYVSRKHAKVVHDGSTWRIQDLGSSNGTFLLKSDFERVEDAEIEDGQEIALGNARMVFHIVPPPSEQ